MGGDAANRIRSVRVGRMVRRFDLPCRNMQYHCIFAACSLHVLRREMVVAASILSVARTLGSVSSWSLSNLEMQKISFIAEMLHLGRTGQPLIFEDWQAWAYGPVQPDLYHRAKVFGTSPVTDIFAEPLLNDGSKKKAAVTDAYVLMSSLTPGQMINVTHQPDGAWAQHFSQTRKNQTIPKSAIKKEYGVLIKNDD